ncbi:MFS transporter [Cupriavidus sp. AU9028]|uniref:MFS transporter n=1 Tax=Cupriavidus sp. AU9028 TaxID=2871157 RepID=UPI001C940F93|nr:MFS transporter [Cupriavidus sp. AU9028]MBY4897164.1 MFS transporter [Cupriavidus sp. AU9028]
MLVNSLSAALHRRGLHYAWLIAALAFLVMLTTSAALGLPGAFLVPLQREHGWNTDEVASVLAVRFALFGLMAPFSAMLIERIGMRGVVTAALLLIAAGMGLATQATALWQLFVAWGLLLGLGSGMTALVLAAVVANRWFCARRGLVIGILTASAATGQLAFLPLAAWLIENVGWRSAVLPVMAACAGLSVLAWIFLRDRPADLGLAPYGDPQPTATGAQAGTMPPRMALSAPFLALRDAAGNRVFWLLAGSFFICGLSTNGLIQTHFIPLCGDFGLGPVPAASVLAMMGAFDLVGTVLSGWLSDRYDSRKLLFWYYGLRGLSLLWLPHSTFSLYGLSLFAAFYGLDWIATVPPTVKLAGATFGSRLAPMVFGWIFAAHQLGAAVAAYGAGLSRTLLLTYSPALYVAGAACFIAALLSLGAGPRTAAVAGASAARA